MVIATSIEELANLQCEQERIRNICIIAHVDHGKTTLSDSLISSNGIISERLAGKLRYLDSTEEEQLRGITMQSSAISLLYESSSESDSTKTQYLINLIDSPGHVDFSSDVSAAVRLCDGALLLVDVVEGICAQTHSVLRQVWKEKVRPCLVLNKIDRLIFELKLSPYEAYQHICRILEQTNAILSAMIRADALSEDCKKNEVIESNRSKEQMYLDWQLTLDENEEKHFFSPSSGNVVFASASDGWAFGIGYFTQYYSKKMDIPIPKLRQAMWGENYYNNRLKKIVKTPPNSSCLPMFVQFVLEPIWSMYFEVLINTSNDERIVQILKSLKIFQLIPERERTRSDRRLALQSIMRQWLPLSSAVLRMVIRVLPNPIKGQTCRISSLFPTSSLEDKSLPSETRNVLLSVGNCSVEEEAPLVVFISKVVSVDSNMILGGPSVPAECLTRLVAIARVYSGVLKADSRTLYVLGSKHIPTSGNDLSSNNISVIQADSLGLYMIMGREYRTLTKVLAGNIVGITGLDQVVLKTATLSSTPLSLPFTSMPFAAIPIVRVAVEPEDPLLLNQLQTGLQELYRSDPTVEVKVEETGEYVIIALGELHLERCVKALRERFAKMPLRVSEPIVGFRETITDGNISNAQQCAVLKQSMGLKDEVIETEELGCFSTVTLSTPNHLCSFSLTAFPLPKSVSQFLEKEEETIRNIALTNGKVKIEENNKQEKQVFDSCIEFQKRLFDLLKQEGEPWSLLTSEQIWAFGPRRCGSNILVSKLSNYAVNSIFHQDENYSIDENLSLENHLLKRIESSIVTGFQLATAAGPLCEEPIWGVLFSVDKIVLNLEKIESLRDLDKDRDAFGPLTGQVISTIKSACRQSFLRRPVRLVEAIYSCDVQCQAEQLGKLFGVLARRRGKVVDEYLSDFGNWFIIKSFLPVIESFGFANDLLNQTSGGASLPQLVFSHWEPIDLDPYFQPTTEEEKEEFGESKNCRNLVRKYIDLVRKRKGLSLDQKIVSHAEKQRTLSRKK